MFSQPGCGTGHARGDYVAVVDADIGLRNLDVILGLENRIVYDLVHVIEGECRLKQALIRDKRVGLYLLPAAQTRDKNAVTPQQMRDLVTKLKDEFDYVLQIAPQASSKASRMLSPVQTAPSSSPRQR